VKDAQVGVAVLKRLLDQDKYPFTTFLTILLGGNMKLRPQITPLKIKTGAIIRICFTVLFVSLLALELSSIASAQKVMNVSERDEESGKAKRIDLDFVGAELQNLLTFISKETDLTIIASEQDIKGKKFSLTNLKNVTIQEALEHIKTILAQYDLTMIRTNKTILITTLDKAVKMKVPTETVNADPNEIKETDEVRTYIIRMKNAVVTDDIIKDLKQMVSKAAVMFVDTNSNSVVVTDIASNTHRIAKILQVIDQQLEVDMKIKIFPLSSGNARSIARTLEGLFEDTAMMGKESFRRGPEEIQKMLQFAKTKGIDVIQGRVMITADEDSNSLIVKASEQNMELVSSLIEQLDAPPDIKVEVKIYKLDYATAEDVADELEEIVMGFSAGKRPGRNARWWERREWEERRRRMREQGSNVESIVGEVNVVSDERLNAVIVGSDPRNFPLIEKIITELDTPDPKEEIKIFFLKNSDAATVVENLQDLFEGGSQRDRDMPWWYRRRDQDREGQEGGFGVQGQVNLIADERLNAILVSTASQNLSIIEQLIEKLDVVMPDQEWGTRIYTLKYADAENVANIINDVFQGDSGRGRGYFFFLPGRSRTQTRSSLAGNVQAQEYVTMNAVIVSTSTARNFELIEDFINELDKPTPEDQKEITRSIRLEYANAEDMQQVLNNIWEGEDSGRFSFRRFFMRGGTPEQKDIESLKGKVQIYADTQTNSLIVTTRKRYIDSVEELIRQLDFVRGMVWLDITILEITLDENTKLGIELSAKEEGIFGLDDWTGEFQSDLGLGDAISGFNYSMATKEYLSLIHTLMEQNKAKTLSTPSFITRDNQPVSFNRGKRVPYLQSARESDYDGIPGQRIYDYDFIDVGITIDIIPHIAKSRADEGEKRTIGLEITDLTVSNFIEFTDFNAPITEDSSISAYIDVKDGQSVVIGGMIRSRRQKIEDKIPILGDIPLVGRLFKKTEDAIEDSELVVIITPRIIDIKNPEDVERLKQHSDEAFPNTDKEIQKHFGDSGMRMKKEETKKE